MYTILFPYVLGLLLAWTTWYPARRLNGRVQRRFFTSIIMIVALGFIGFPLEDADNIGLAYEAAAAVVLVLLTLLSRRAIWLLPLVWFGHGCWDMAYLFGLVPVDKPLWVVQLCVPYDWLLAGYLLTRARAWELEAREVAQAS